ncbi:DUF6777 domain-containing protein [Streptomyces sp. NPDC044571]|uniref:DUF6777 domain-containing protein n=1 Tax=Streptomyces sp. NPDC044571 TaxID=3155371 RepID=UPI0033F91CD3
MATAVTALAAAVVLAMVLTRPSGTTAGGEVFLQPAAAQGQDPFTESTANQPPGPPPAPSSLPPAPATGTITTQAVPGSSPTLYGGTADIAGCDSEKQARFLSARPDANRAFAEALGIQATAVPEYLRSLTSVTLRKDTRVTNHGYRNGSPTSYQAVLQAGTAVMVDNHGVPRVRCACGNPLGEPKALKPGYRRRGESWAMYRPQNIVVIQPTVKAITKITIYDHTSGRWYARESGQQRPDQPIQAPARPPADTDTGSETAPPAASPPSSPPPPPPPAPPSPSPPSSPPESPPSSPPYAPPPPATAAPGADR